jgi:hypothetical protein
MFPPEIWAEILSYYLESNSDGFCPVPLVCKAWKLYYDSSDPRRFELFLSYYPSVYRLATLYVFLHYVEIGTLKRVSLSDRHFLDICTDERGLCLLDLGGEEIVQISQDGTLIRGGGNYNVIFEVCSFFVHVVEAGTITNRTIYGKIVHIPEWHHMGRAKKYTACSVFFDSQHACYKRPSGRAHHYLELLPDRTK